MFLEKQPGRDEIRVKERAGESKKRKRERTSE